MTLSIEELTIKVKDIVAEVLQINPNSISSQSIFAGDLGADSLDFVQIQIEIEDYFEIEVPDEVAAGISTVAQAVTYLSKVLD